MATKLGREVAAMRVIERAMEPLDTAERDRIAAWVSARYRLSVAQILAKSESEHEPTAKGPDGGTR